MLCYNRWSNYINFDSCAYYINLKVLSSFSYNFSFSIANCIYIIFYSITYSIHVFMWEIHKHCNYHQFESNVLILEEKKKDFASIQSFLLYYVRNQADFCFFVSLYFLWLFCWYSFFISSALYFLFPSFYCQTVWHILLSSSYTSIELNMLLFIWLAHLTSSFYYTK